MRKHATLCLIMMEVVRNLGILFGLQCHYILESVTFNHSYILDMQEHCNMLKEKNQEKHNRIFKDCEENGSEKDYILKKSPSAA